MGSCRGGGFGWAGMISSIHEIEKGFLGQARDVTLAVAAAITAAGIKHLGLEPRRRRGRWPLKESTKQLCDDKRAAYHTWHALKVQYEQQVLGGMEGA